MSFYRAQSRIPNDTGQAADQVVNTFHFATNDVGSKVEEAEDIWGQVGNWLLAVDGFLSENLATPATVTVYDLEDAEPRVPVYEDTVALTLGSSSAANQVALVMRYRANYTSGVARARRRGRLFIGPLSTDAFDGVGDNTPSASQTSLIAAAGAALGPTITGVTSGSTISWSVFSRAIFADTPGSVATKLAAAFSTVVECSVPNRFGTQRRRSTEVTAVTVTPL